MKFDKLVKMYEKHHEYFPAEMGEVLKKAKIFILDGAPHNMLGNFCAPESLENFFLPFPVIAVEDKAGLTILIDSEVNQIGTKSPRLFIDMISADSKAKDFRPEEQNAITKLKTRGEVPDSCTIVFGTIDKFEIDPHQATNYQRTSLLIGGNVNLLLYGTPKKMLGVMGHNDIQKMLKEDQKGLRSSLTNASICMQEVILINTPKNFILEETGPKVPKPGSKVRKKILRSWERQIYTIMNPGNIRKKMGLSPGIGSESSKAPHERRKHDRWYRHKKYSKDEFGDPRKALICPKGEGYYLHQIIPASWIGPSSSSIGNKIYKVRLDL